MSDDAYSFSTARARLDEIVTQVRKKDTSLEKSLDLLEEGVRLANACTELIDHADWTVGGVESPSAEATEPAGTTDEPVVAESAGPDQAVAGSPEAEADDTDADFAPDDDAFGDAADEAWADGAPEYRDDEA